MARRLSVLERSRAEQEVDDVAFVGLEPVELGGGDGADVEAVDVMGVGEHLDEPLVFRDAGWYVPAFILTGIGLAFFISTAISWRLTKQWTGTSPIANP